MQFLRLLFLRWSLRERSLVTAVLVTCLLAWAIYLIRDLRSQVVAFQNSGRDLESQQEILGRSEAAQLRLKAALQDLDSSRTFSAQQLEGKIDDMAREIGFSRFDLSSASTIESDIFATHQLRLRIDRGNLGDIIRFNDALQKETPYIVLNQFLITANRRDPRQLDTNFEISSFELKDIIGQ